MITQTYQITCNCGKTHSVVTRQAGETLACECGQSIEIPPLRAMRHLPSVELAQASPGAGAWSRLQGSLFVVGLLATLISVGMIANFGWRRSQLVTEAPKLTDEVFVFDIMQITPSQSWIAWTEEFRGKELGTRDKPFHQVNREVARRYRGLMIAAGVFLSLGLAAIVASFAIRA